MEDFGKVVYSSILSMIAIFLSIVAIFTTRPYNWNTDFVGVAVAVLSILVALLVCWQIYNTLGIQKEIHDIKGKLESEYNKINERMTDFEEKSNKKIEKTKSDFEKKVTENGKSTNDVKAMLFSVCGDLLNIQYNNPLQSYEYYLYALRNYLFGGNKQPSVDRTLAKMKACLSAVKGEAEFQDMEMFYSILQEIKSSGKLNEKQFELLKTMENKREELKN